MPFQVSPGVSIREIDLSTTIPSVSSADAGTVIDAEWGPVDEVVLVSSEQDLIQLFGRPSANVTNSDKYRSWLSAANFLSYSNKLRLVRANSTGLNASTGTATVQIKNHTDFNELQNGTTNVEWSARYPGNLGNSLKVSVASGPGAFSNATAAVLNVTSGVASTGDTTVALGGGTGIETGVIAVGDYISFPGNSYPSQQYRVTNLTAPAAGANVATISPALVEDLEVGATTVRRDWAYASLFGSEPNKTNWALGYEGSSPGTELTAEALHAVVLDADGKITGKRDSVLEIWPSLSKAKNAIDPESGRTLYYQDAINERSNWIYWGGETDEHPATSKGEWGATANTTSITFAQDLSASSDQMTGGDEATAATNADKIKAYDLFRNTEDIDLSVIFTGDADATVAKHVVQNVAEARKDCVVCVSPERADVVPANGLTAEGALTNVLDYRKNQLVISSSYGILDSGWKYVLDKYNNKFRWIPLNSDVAGCIVRTDTERDPWFSPAGYNRGQIKNVIKLAWSPNKAQRDDLYRNDVNPVVTFPGRGTVLFGDKTLYGRNSAFDRINVRRLFIVLEKAIATASKFLLFEFNDEFTRAQFRNMVEPFLRDVQGRRGITDFKVVCDETNNPGSVVDRSEFVGDIYIKPARSINYIQLNFVAAATGVEFSEIIGQAS